MAKEEEQKHHTLSKLNKTLCRFLAVLMICMCISYYITTLLQVRLTRLSSETIKLNNENVELQNKLDNLMSYHNVENLVRQKGTLDTATDVVEIDGDAVVIDKNEKFKKKKYYPDYYRWSLGF